jgi:hypothetical protein
MPEIRRQIWRKIPKAAPPEAVGFLSTRLKRLSDRIWAR